MLRTLGIRDLAIIDELDIEFGSGLNILTGETGAGKSIIVGALQLVLGGRAAPDVVRAGAQRAIVDAVFEVTGAEQFIEALEAMGYDAPDGELALSREVHDTGKSTARIGGRPATVTALREVGEWLVDLHGQHEHQSLLSVKRHGELLDSRGGDDLRRALDAVSASWDHLRQMEERLAHLETDARERLRLMDLYRFQMSEIASAELRPGEEEELQDELLRLRNVERLRESVTSALQWLKGPGGSAVDALACAGRDLDAAGAMDSSLLRSAEAVEAARFEMEEVARNLDRYLDELEADPARLDAVQERLGRIADLKRKYGASIEEVIAFGQQAADELAEMERIETDSDSLRTDLEAVRMAYREACERLTGLRHAAAERLQKEVEQQFADVALGEGRFEVAITPATPGRGGADAVEFLFAANAGEPRRPLARIASGGEISRVMLAIKAAAALQSPLPTMVFDEIDVGIGGRTADAIGRKMRKLAGAAQVICITHLAQIAAAADRHYAIEKTEQDGRTVVRVSMLDHDQRVAELARMLAGTHVTEAVLEHVRGLLTREIHA